MGKDSAMPDGDIETYRKDGKWRNKVEGDGELRGEYDARIVAVENGRAEARDRHVGHCARSPDGAADEVTAPGPGRRV